MEGIHAVPLPGLVQKVFHAYGFQNPGRGGFQVVQEHAACRLTVREPGSVGGHIQAQTGAQLCL